MMEKFDMGKFLQEAGVNLDTGNRKQVVDIPIDRIVPDPNNFYELSAIDDLAENIALFGLQQPIVVRPMPEDGTRYIIVSGHRRHAALKKLIEEDGRDDLREVTCIVEQGEENPDLQQLKLIYANASTRVLSSAEQAKQAEQVEQLLYRLKESGMEFPGRMRDHVAAACQMSTGKLARLKMIRDCLEDCWRNSYESGLLREACAYELARTAPQWQKLIYEKFGKSESKTTDLTSDAIVTYRKRLSDIEELTCKKTNGVCSNKERMRKKALEVSRWYFCNCINCCSECDDIVSCKYVCQMMQDKVKRMKQENEKRQQQKEADAAERDRPDIDLIRGIYARFFSARKAKGLTVKQIAEKIAMPYSNDEIERLEDGTGKFEKRSRLPFGYSLFLSDVKSICAAADLLGCSIDYLLGRTDSPTFAAAPTAEPEKCVNVDTWNTGTPTEPGRYVGLVQYDSSCSLSAEETIWKDGAWELFGETTEDYGIKVIYWAKFPKEITHPLNCGCITGMSPSGHCGAAFYCDSEADCCLKCDEKCSIRCGWIDAGEDT